MAENEIETAKAALRASAQKRRASLSAAARGEAARAVAQHFFDALAPAAGEVVAAYWPIRDEVDCQPILIRLMDAGQPVCLPVVLGAGEPLEMRQWQQGAALYPSGFGTLAPADDAPQLEPDVVLMPLLGFDRAGTRLGYGGGYYDRTLARLRKRPRLIGLAFVTQEVDAIPRAEHDIPLDFIVTEAGVRRFVREEVTS